MMCRIGFRRVLPLVFCIVHAVLICLTPAPPQHGMPHLSPLSRDMGTRADGGQDSIPAAAGNLGSSQNGKGTASAVPQTAQLTWASAPEGRRGLNHTFSRCRIRGIHQEVGGMPTEPIYEPRPLRPAQKLAVLVSLPAIAPAEIISSILLPQNEAAWLYVPLPFILLLWYSIGRWLDGILGYRPRILLPGPLRRVVGMCASALLFLSIAMFTPLYHHRSVDSFWIASGFIFWSVFCLGVVFSSGDA